MNWLTILVFVGLVFLMSSLRVPWPLWMLFFLAMPMITRAMNRASQTASQRGNWRHHRGHQYHTPHERRTPWNATPREKRKNGYTPRRVEDIDDMLDDMDDQYFEEKPKRRPVYVVGDDGELVEMIEEPPFEQPKAKRAGGNEDGYEYI